MPFAAIAVKQSKTISAVGEDGTVTISPDTAFTVGNLAVLLVSAVNTDGETVRVDSVSDGINTWVNQTNVRSAATYVPNAFLAVALNIAAGTPTITLTLNRVSGNSINVTLVEVENAPTSSAVEIVVTGTGTGAFTSSTGATGTLSQTDNLCLVIGAGWFGNPDGPSGWTELTGGSVTNGSGPGYVGHQASWLKVTATTSVTATVNHPESNTSNVSLAMVVIRAKTTGVNLRLKFNLNSSQFNSTKTGLTALVWRNGPPDGVLAKRFTGLAGDATAGVLYITSASGLLTAYPDLALTDIINAYVYSSTEESGYIGGIVESY